MIVLPAQKEDIESILKITHDAFLIYKHELDVDTPLKALSETEKDILIDINENNVYVVKSKLDNSLLGAIRFKLISENLAYIYRFAVNPTAHNTGVGTMLFEKVINECKGLNISAICLHTNLKYDKLVRYYYGKQFYVHSTSTTKGYMRALFVKELNDRHVDLSKANEY